MKTKRVIAGYFVLGTIWNAVVLPIVAASHNFGVTWYEALGVGLLAGGIVTIVGETVLRSADKALWREHGVLAWFSPSIWFRVVFTLVPGIIARLVGSAESRVVVDDQRNVTFLDRSNQNQVIAVEPWRRGLAPGVSVEVNGRSYEVLNVREDEHGNHAVSVQPS